MEIIGWMIKDYPLIPAPPTATTIYRKLTSSDGGICSPTVGTIQTVVENDQTMALTGGGVINTFFTPLFL